MTNFNQRKIDSLYNDLRHEQKQLSDAQKWISYYSNLLSNSNNFRTIGGKLDTKKITGFQFELKKWQKEAASRSHSIEIIMKNIKSAQRNLS